MQRTTVLPYLCVEVRVYKNDDCICETFDLISFLPRYYGVACLFVHSFVHSFWSVWVIAIGWARVVSMLCLALLLGIDYRKREIRSSPDSSNSI